MNKHISHTELEAKLRKLGAQLTIEEGVKEDLRSHILGQVVTTDRLPKKTHPTRWLLNWAPGFVILLIVASSGTAVLADSAKPGDTLYVIDLFAEKVEHGLVRDEIAKAKLYAAISEERVAEKEALQATDPTTLDKKSRARWEHSRKIAIEKAVDSLERLIQVQAIVLEKYEAADNPHQKEAYLKLSKSLQQVIDRKAKRAQTLEEILKETADTNRDKDDETFELDESIRKKIIDEIRKEFRADRPKRGDPKPNDIVLPDPNVPEDLQRPPRDTNSNGIPDQDEPEYQKPMDAEVNSDVVESHNGIDYGNNSMIESGVNQILKGL